MRKIELGLGTILARLSIVFASLTVNSTCPFLAYQPKMTDAIKKLRRF